MVSPPAHLRRHFLSWDQPLLPQAVTFLTGGWQGEGPLDLSTWLVVVPTRQAGRRLREALAGHAAEKKQAVFPPRVMSPEALISHGLAPDTASRLESLLAWTEVLRALDLEEFREVFPVDPPVRNFAWALRLAREFVRLQAALAEGGLMVADVVAAAGGDFPEAARWREIEQLEQLHSAHLAARGRRDGQAARIAAAARPELPAGIGRILLLATPDPLPLALTRLAAHARTVPVEVAIFAPPAEAAAFDAWGRPAPAVWERRALDLPEFERRVHLCADPTAQAARIAAVARRHEQPEGLLGLGITDTEVLPLLENELAREGIATFNPEGRSRSRDALYQLLAALAALAEETSFPALEALARCPDYLSFLRVRCGASFSAARFLAGLDELRSRHLPADLAAARRHAPALKHFQEVPAALEITEELLAMLKEGTFATGAAEALTTLFAGRRLDLSREADAELEDAAAVWTDVLRECAAAAENFATLSRAEWWDLALRLYGETARTDEKEAGALELQGWLELLWEDAPHLAIAGLNDGRVPEAVAGDPFLPEALREKLGLKTNAARLARDAYVLQALVACRGGPNSRGRVDLFFGKVSAVGDPLRPSRLLLRCRDEVLPERISFLFGAPEQARPSPSWMRAWRVAPRRVAPPSRVAVTALRAYLQCPFRFYLRHVLRMTPVDPAKSELDALDFGTLCHAALEKLGTAADLRDCADASVLKETLLRELDRAVQERYGEDLSLPLVIQLESARQRLSKAAEVQAAERAAGWVIEHVERKFEIEIEGIVVSGKIDRIDRHVETGAVRVIDYKTSDTAVAPADAHLRSLRPGEQMPDWALFDVGNKPRVWADLQLPLYRRALAAEFPGEILCGYFNLPKAAGETGLAFWENASLELHEAAWRCAAGVCAAIQAGRFWPPSETVRADYDDCAALFHHGAADSVSWSENEGAACVEAGARAGGGAVAPAAEPEGREA